MSDRHDFNFSVDALADLRAQFVQALEAEPAATALRRQWLPRLSPRPIWAAALVASVAIVLAGFFLLQGGKVTSVQEATATVADTALNAPYPPDDWYTYTDELLTGRRYGGGRGLVGPGYTLKERRRSWLSVARDGVLISRELKPHSEPVIAAVPAGVKYRIGQQRYTRDEIDAFARNPRALIEAIDSESAGTRAEYRAFAKWDTITGALSDIAPPLPPQLRSALIRELGTIPGVHVVNADTDPDGRPAIGLYYDFQQVRNTVYFDKYSALVSWGGKTALADGAGTPGDMTLKKGELIEGFNVLERRTMPTLPPDAVTALSQAEVPD